MSEAKSVFDVIDEVQQQVSELDDEISDILVKLGSTVSTLDDEVKAARGSLQDYVDELDREEHVHPNVIEKLEETVKFLDELATKLY